jgi:hypothetical protein
MTPHPVTAALIEQHRARAAVLFGVPATKTGPARLYPNQAEIDAIKRLRGIGWSIESLAGYLGYSRRVVNRWVHDLGLSRRWRA